MELILASASPRRRELLALLTPNFSVVPTAVDEAAAQKPGMAPPQAAGLLAELKARALFGEMPKAAVLGCDTVVHMDESILGKPKNREQAAEMLQRLSGRAHFVHTGICLLYPGPQGRARQHSYVETTKVFFAPLPDDDIAKYVKTAEPYDKAGAYGIQGWAAKYIPRIEGCYYNVMGLPVASLLAALRRAGILA